jgi:diaminopimelate epimerase
MQITFSKLHGAGNDFILIDNRSSEISLTNEQVFYLCHRKYGIGADGLILLMNSTVDGLDFSMKYYNSDGFEGTMCGNGGRCITAFAASLGYSKSHFTFEAIDGIHHSEIIAHNGTISYDIKLKMIDVSSIELFEDDVFLNTGSPHLVVFVDNAKNAAVEGMGKMLRFDQRFAPAGTNVNFASFSKGRLFVRTYERGVEAETLSCGTGITASAIAIANKLNLPFNTINVDALGGSFVVTFEQNGDKYQNIWLRGPVKHSFNGTIEIH